MNAILVVCEGNICRSPMGQGLLQRALPRTRVTSGGLGALVGSPADETAVRLMAERGIDIAHHRAMQINRDMCLRADLVLTMDNDQRRRLEEAYPIACGRIFRVGEFIKQDVPDPYRQSESVFRISLALLEAGVREWLKRIEQLARAPA